jgi:hypothetical protein
MRPLPHSLRALATSSLCALVLLGVAPAPADAITSPVVHALDVRIAGAEHRIEHWNRALGRWQADVGHAAAALQRIQASSGVEPPAPIDYFSPRMANRTLLVPPTWPERVESAHARLQAVLRDHAAREAQQQQQAWTAYLGQLQAARVEAVQAARHSGLSGVVPGSPITYEAWAKGLLSALGAPSCENNVLLVVTWETAESTQAAYNPLATTHEMPGAGSFNTVGVKNYVSADQGLEASRDTLLGGADSYGYVAIVDALRACAPAETTASAIRDSAWCRGCAVGAYVVGLLPIVRSGWDEHAGRLISTPAA